MLKKNTKRNLYFSAKKNKQTNSYRKKKLKQEGKKQI